MLRRQEISDSFLAVDDVSFTVAAGRVDRADGAQRLRQVHAAQADQRRHAARPRRGAHPRPDRRADRHRRRLPPAAHRPRQRLPQRRDPRDERGGDQAQVRRDRRVRRHRPVPRHPGRATTPPACSPGSGFAVAVHTDSDIFLVDEVLAVGDKPFKRSASRGWRRSGDEGRTLFYVSHAAGSVRKMCDRVLVLEKGVLGYDGPVDEGIQLPQVRRRPRTTSARRSRETTTTRSSAPTSDVFPHVRAFLVPE